MRHSRFGQNKVPSMKEDRFRTLHEIVKAARLNLNQTDWDYLIGGTETETTLKRNRHAIDGRALRPFVLNDVSSIDCTTEFFGATLAMPVMLAPIGSLQVFDAGGGASAAIAAENAGIASMASSVCSPSIEDIAAAANNPKFYQLYVRGDDAWVDEVLARVTASGYLGLCLTVDTAVVSRRERDIAKRVIPTSQAAGHGDFTFQASLSWKDIERIKQKSTIPIFLKGLSRVDDVRRALDIGMDAIYLSNHGGRQLDHGPGALDVLEDVVREIDIPVPLIVDGGFYRGSDIVKAIAMGANMVGLGRLEAWALAAGGVEALTACLRILRAEIVETMALCGTPRLSDLTPALVENAPVVTDSDVLSAFPLLSLDEGY